MAWGMAGAVQYLEVYLTDLDSIVLIQTPGGGECAYRTVAKHGALSRQGLHQKFVIQVWTINGYVK